MLFSIASRLVLLASIVAVTRGDIGSSKDPSSYSNVDQFTPDHISFAFEVDFNTTSISGNVTHTLFVLDGNETEVYMDVWDAIVVHSAELKYVPLEGAPKNDILEGYGEFSPVPFNISTPNPNIGNALKVTLPEAMPEGTTFYLRFSYTTTAGNTAISWMTPEQTAGKDYPFMYTLCQMNFCRDFAPMMDTPSQKITYDAVVLSPKELVVRMSANTTKTEDYNETHTLTTFDDQIKIPSYLIAIVVGDLHYQALSDRVGVMTEKPYLEAAVEEFSDLPAVFDEMEEYLTPYIWGNYSIVIMPPSFPWGGMEHPLVTFASHTLITGDKSQVDTAIHEMTHSWFGNDVGCMNWSNFWLNEGMNVFMERKMLAFLHGKNHSKIHYFTGNTSLYEDMLDYGLNDSYSSLYPQIGDDDPENSFSGVPYEKGSQFVYYMESLIGEEMMQLLLREYIDTFAQKAIHYTEFQALYEEFVNTNFDNETAAEINNATMWDKWVTSPGDPPVMQDFRTEELDMSVALANEYILLGTDGGSPDGYEDYNEWESILQKAFVQTLQGGGDEVDADLLAHVDADLNITNTPDPQVKNLWFVLGITKGYGPVTDPAYVWMGEQGRNAYVKPVFQALVDVGRCEEALAWFDDYKDFYNSYVVNGVKKILKECDEADGGDVDANNTRSYKEGEDEEGMKATTSETTLEESLAFNRDVPLGMVSLLAFAVACVWH